MHLQATAEPPTMAAHGTRTPLPGAYLSASQIATLLGVHRATVYRAIKSGDLIAVGLGQGRGGLRVSQDALAEWLTNAEVRPVNSSELAEVA